MSRNARLGLIVAVALVAFGGAFLLFRDDDGSDTPVVAGPTVTTVASGPCPSGAAIDTAYAVSFPTPPRADSGTFVVMVMRNGQPVTGAKVCIGADMSGMSHPPVSGEATELSGGRYEVKAKFSMRGGWQGSVMVFPASGSAALIPITFDVV